MQYRFAVYFGTLSIRSDRNLQIMMSNAVFATLINASNNEKAGSSLCIATLVNLI